MTADIDLPVWTIAPNWKDGITERLEWLTDVLASTYGTEQRRALRLSPRRGFEVNFLPLDEERTFFDLWLHRLGSNECMLPLWHDRGSLTAAVNAGATTIPVDTTFREFVEGGLAIIIGPDAFTWDKVTITAIADSELTVSAGGVTRSWPAGSVIHPLRRARLDEESVAAAITSKVGQATIRFDLNQANDIPDEGAWADIYGDYPIILTEPNRRDNLELRFQRNRILLDNDVGLRELADDAGRAFTLQTHQLLLNGRDEQWAFRQMLYRLRGQQAAVWVPTFNRDVELSRDAAAADTQIDIKQIGYAYTGGSVSGRRHLLIGGTTPRQVTGTAAPLSGSEERLLLDGALGADFPAGAFGSFVDICRLGQDTIEIKHITDSDGVAESNLTFRAFRDERTPPDPIYAPIAFGQLKSVNPCGAPDSATCIPDLTAGSSGPAEDGTGDDPDGGGDPGPGAGAGLLIDFKNGVYIINGANVALADAVQSGVYFPYLAADVVPGVGLRAHADSVESAWKTGPALTAAAQDAAFAGTVDEGFTAVMTYSVSAEIDSVAEVYLYIIADDASSGWYFNWSSGGTAFGANTGSLSDFSTLYVPFPTTQGLHKAAITLASDRLAVSIDGAAVVVSAAPQPMTEPLQIYPSAQAHIDPGGDSATSIIERIEIIATVADSVLPTLSV